jgi:hypothetical protein
MRRVEMLEKATEKPVECILQIGPGRRLRAEGAIERDEAFFRRHRRPEATILVGANPIGGFEADAQALVEGALLTAQYGPSLLPISHRQMSGSFVESIRACQQIVDPDQDPEVFERPIAEMRGKPRDAANTLVVIEGG